MINTMQDTLNHVIRGRCILEITVYFIGSLSLRPATVSLLTQENITFLPSNTGIQASAKKATFYFLKSKGSISCVEGNNICFLDNLSPLRYGRRKLCIGLWRVPTWYTTFIHET